MHHLSRLPLSSILRAFPHRQESRSRDVSVLLVNMTSESSGRYTCEVSVEPTFETTSQSATLVVGDDSSCASESSLARRLESRDARQRMQSRDYFLSLFVRKQSSSDCISLLSLSITPLDASLLPLSQPRRRRRDSCCCLRRCCCCRCCCAGETRDATCAPRIPDSICGQHTCIRCRRSQPQQKEQLQLT